MKTSRIEEIREQRQRASRADPLEVKSLAIAYQITPAQVRALLLQCGSDRLKFNQDALRLRAH